MGAIRVLYFRTVHIVYKRKTDFDKTQRFENKIKKKYQNEIKYFSVCSLSGLFSEKKRDRRALARMKADDAVVHFFLPSSSCSEAAV